MGARRRWWAALASSLLVSERWRPRPGSASSGGSTRRARASRSLIPSCRFSRSRCVGWWARELTLRDSHSEVQRSWAASLAIWRRRCCPATPSNHRRSLQQHAMPLPLPSCDHRHLAATLPQEARLRELMADLHESFKERVRGSRGERLAAGQDGELFSGGWRLGGRGMAPRGRWGEEGSLGAGRSLALGMLLYAGEAVCTCSCRKKVGLPPLYPPPPHPPPTALPQGGPGRGARRSS